MRDCRFWLLTFMLFSPLAYSGFSVPDSKHDEDDPEDVTLGDDVPTPSAPSPASSVPAADPQRPQALKNCLMQKLRNEKAQANLDKIYPAIEKFVESQKGSGTPGLAGKIAEMLELAQHESQFSSLQVTVPSGHSFDSVEKAGQEAKSHQANFGVGNISPDRFVLRPRESLKALAKVFGLPLPAGIERLSKREALKAISDLIPKDFSSIADRCGSPPTQKSSLQGMLQTYGMVGHHLNSLVGMVARDKPSEVTDAEDKAIQFFASLLADCPALNLEMMLSEFQTGRPERYYQTISNLKQAKTPLRGYCQNEIAAMLGDKSSQRGNAAAARRARQEASRSVTKGGKPTPVTREFSVLSTDVDQDPIPTTAGAPQESAKPPFGPGDDDPLPPSKFANAPIEKILEAGADWKKIKDNFGLLEINDLMPRLTAYEDDSKNDSQTREAAEQLKDKLNLVALEAENHELEGFVSPENSRELIAQIPAEAKQMQLEKVQAEIAELEKILEKFNKNKDRFPPDGATYSTYARKLALLKNFATLLQTPPETQPKLGRVRRPHPALESIITKLENESRQMQAAIQAQAQGPAAAADGEVKSPPAQTPATAPQVQPAPRTRAAAPAPAAAVPKPYSQDEITSILVDVQTSTEAHSKLNDKSSAELIGMLARLKGSLTDDQKKKYASNLANLESLMNEKLIQESTENLKSRQLNKENAADLDVTAHQRAYDDFAEMVRDLNQQNAPADAFPEDIDKLSDLQLKKALEENRTATLTIIKQAFELQKQNYQGALASLNGERPIDPQAPADFLDQLRQTQQANSEWNRGHNTHAKDFANVIKENDDVLKALIKRLEDLKLTTPAPAPASGASPAK